MQYNTSQKIKVLVVDDSVFIRTVLSQIINEDPDCHVVGQARNGREGVDMALELKPDIITMDIIMPVLNGLDAIDMLKGKVDAKILVISSLTEEGAFATFDALSRGAVDFITKSTGDSTSTLIRLKSEVVSKIKQIYVSARSAKSARTRFPSSPPPPRASAAPYATGGNVPDVLAIGSSTGGPMALQTLLPQFEKGFPISGLIVQHMPTEFIGPFASRLNDMSNVTIKVAEDGEMMEGGIFYVAPGNHHLKVSRGLGMPGRIQLDPEPAGSLHRPSVDQLYHSVARSYKDRALAVILTGMGQDGVIGAVDIVKLGGKILAQDELSSVVYGMPRAIVDGGYAHKVHSITNMYDGILAVMNKK